MHLRPWDSDVDADQGPDLPKAELVLVLEERPQTVLPMTWQSDSGGRPPFGTQTLAELLRPALITTHMIFSSFLFFFHHGPSINQGSLSRFRRSVT